MSFEIGSLRYVKYIEKKPTQYQLHFWGEGNLQSKILKRDQKKMNAAGTHSTDIAVSCQKRLNKNMALRFQSQILILV